MTICAPGPAYRIHTTRLVIRCWNPSDAPLLSQAIEQSLEHLRPWMPWANEEPKDLQGRGAWLRQRRAEFDLDQNFVYGIFDPAETEVLGGTGLHRRVGENALEIGYWVRQDRINRGLATEVSAALTRVAFEIHHVSRVEIRCDPRNVRSAAVPRKLGYQHEATLRKRVPDHEGKLCDSMVWTLFAEDYPNSPSAKAAIEAFDALGQRIL